MWVTSIGYGDSGAVYHFEFYYIDGTVEVGEYHANGLGFFNYIDVVMFINGSKTALSGVCIRFDDSSRWGWIDDISLKADIYVIPPIPPGEAPPAIEIIHTYYDHELLEGATNESLDEPLARNVSVTEGIYLSMETHFSGSYLNAGCEVYGYETSLPYLTLAISNDGTHVSVLLYDEETSLIASIEGDMPAESLYNANISTWYFRDLSRLYLYVSTNATYYTHVDVPSAINQPFDGFYVFTDSDDAEGSLDYTFLTFGTAPEPTPTPSPSPSSTSTPFFGFGFKPTPTPTPTPIEESIWDIISEVIKSWFSFGVWDANDPILINIIRFVPKSIWLIVIAAFIVVVTTTINRKRTQIIPP